MNIGSRLVFPSLLVVSGALHLAALTLIPTAPSVEIKGGGFVAETSMGASFADLAEGIQRPSEISQKAITPVTPGIMPPVKAVAETPVPTSPSEITPVVNHDLSDALPPKTSTPPESVVASVSVNPQRPIKRPDRPKTNPAPKASAPKGTPSRNATPASKSNDAGKPAQIRQAAKTPRQASEGNAAASNYPGQVMRRISRVPRPRVSARGVAVIAFAITPNGQLASAAVAASSGSVQLDRAALAVVHKAQPFPPPPSGARRSYSIKIKGR